MHHGRPLQQSFFTSQISVIGWLSSWGEYPCGDMFLPNELNHPITDIWLVKKDCCKGRPWCIVIGYEKPNTNFTVVTFNDPFVKPNDFYYIVIRQKGEMLSPGNDEYMAFLGPIFIDNVE